MSELEKYQETGRRTPTDFNAKDQQVSMSEEIREKEIRMERRKQHAESLESEWVKQIWSNIQKRYIPEWEWNDEMIEKEQELREFLFGN